LARASGQWRREENKIVPIEQYGLRLMSMGFLLDDASPAILRGPMVTRYTQQFFCGRSNGANWIIWCSICRPAPGDIQTNHCADSRAFGAIVVTTPQEVALIDARKAATMFDKVNVPILGLIET